MADVSISRERDVLRVRLERPEKRNALSRSLLAQIGAAFADHAADPALKAAVLTGAGERAFAAGGDLRELAAVAPLRARAPQVIRAYKAMAISPDAEMEGFVRTWTLPDHWAAADRALAKPA